jgi:hypothetical protein
MTDPLVHFRIPFSIAGVHEVFFADGIEVVQAESAD